MTDQPDPSVRSGATSSVAAASPPPASTPTSDPPPVDTTHAAPGPLFMDTHGNLADADPPATEAPTSEAPTSEAPTSEAPTTAPPATGPSVSGPGPAPTARHAEPLSMTKPPVTGKNPWTGGRAPYADGATTIITAARPESPPDVDVPVRPFVPLQERPAAMLGTGPAAVFPVPNGPTRAALGTDVVTCPECGQLATVDMARRQAEDFCRRCDFPLFWARGTVITPEGEASGASLRRLPGTVGRAATAALICPHCAEPNSPSAEICVRCALSLHPIDIPEPEPVVIFAPPPEPEPEPEPEPGFDWWWIVALVTALVGIVLIVALLYLR